MIWRSEKYRRAVAELPCIYCGLHGRSQAAHANAGKGRGIKTGDETCFPLCAARPGFEGHHVAFDQYRLLAGGRQAHVDAGEEWGRRTRRVLGLRQTGGVWVFDGRGDHG